MWNILFLLIRVDQYLQTRFRWPVKREMRRWKVTSHQPGESSQYIIYKEGRIKLLCIFCNKQTTLCRQIIPIQKEFDMTTFHVWHIENNFSFYILSFQTHFILYLFKHICFDCILYFEALQARHRYVVVQSSRGRNANNKLADWLVLLSKPTHLQKLDVDMLNIKL